MSDKHTVSPENAQKFAEWIDFRGGVAIWQSINLGNPGGQWSTPALDIQGNPTQKPTWEASSKPVRVITHAADVEVVIAKEVKRFHVGVKRGSGLFSFVLTDAATRRVRREVEKAGDTAWYEFDFDAQDAIICVVDKKVPLTTYIEEVKLAQDVVAEIIEEEKGNVD